jgi:uncharacterized membrane protein YdjX (TVP38/TMEM64 family)
MGDPRQSSPASARAPSVGAGGSRARMIAYAACGIALIGIGVHAHNEGLLRKALEWIGPPTWRSSLVFIGIYVAATVLLIPGSVLTLGAGAAFGLPWGSACVSIAATLGAACAFLIGRHIKRDFIGKKFQRDERFAAIDRAVAQEGWKVVALARLSPLFPFTLLNYAFGLTRVNFWHYVAASWAGMLPGTVMYVHLGSVANAATVRSRSTAEWAFYGLGLVATILVTIQVTRMARQALHRRIGS